jgi:hypothetical protein
MNSLLANVIKINFNLFPFKNHHQIGSEGTKSAYTADEFRRLFRVYFDQDFAKEKVLNRTVETFLNEQEQSCTLFEYAVELINEVRIMVMKTNCRKFSYSLIICMKILKINENISEIFSRMIISIHLLSKMSSPHLRFNQIFYCVIKIF